MRNPASNPPMIAKTNSQLELKDTIRLPRW
jgi:hypothetical protein